MKNVLTARIRREKEYNALTETLKEQLDSRVPRPSRLIGLCEGARHALFAALLEETQLTRNGPALLLVPDEKEMMRTFTALTALGRRPTVFRFRDYVFYNIASSHEFEHERLGTLTALLDGSCDCVIATPDAALQYTIPKERLKASVRTVSVGDTVDLEELLRFLAESGYRSAELVDGPGQFSVRGGILDFFSPGAEEPVRMEFFGDEIDSMGYFDVLTQRRTEATDSVRLMPARELLADGEARVRIDAAIASLRKRCRDDKAQDLLAAEKEALSSGEELRFADKYIRLIYPEKVCLLDYFGPQSLFLCEELSAVTERVRSYEWHMKQAVTSLLEEGLVASSWAEYGKWHDDFDDAVSSHPGLVADTFFSNSQEIRFLTSFNMLSRQTVSYSENFDLLCEDLLAYRNNGYDTVILCENEIMAKNLSAMLAERGITAPVCRADAEEADRLPTAVIYEVGIAGFELTASRCAVLSTYPAGSIYVGVRRSAGRKKHGKKTSQEKIMSYTDLQTGDYVVHVNHGIGMFLGIESVTVEGVTRDYIKIKYAGTDVLYLPCEQLDSISKYIGAKGEDGTLKLSRMGGVEWTRTKTQVKAAAKEMAKELIRLYAERQRLPGFAFPADDEMQRDFEAAFPYTETDGQRLAIKEVKQDMEQPRPMDRLLCGDVGFGKTEVALRSAFKAVEAGKQVAFLVPTTILALQHYQTLLARVRGFPVHVEMLSRFSSGRQQQETLRRLRRGAVDILVGTHRIVSDDVVFKDLGLVIVDEEQRFGVAAKEKLKRLSAGVDTLTLTATPIPRTLNMAMSGIRDMSLLEEAPSDRFPVQTYVLEYDDVIVAEAIRKELRRGGQVFYLHNRVESMPDILAKVSQMAPEARIASAHGKMDKEELSDIWRSMLNGEIDILVSTTIIEAGVDVPNANTLIIENADKLGLAQLHQIRGRVGRSSRRAYAYFTYPRGVILSEIATKRLGAIREYTEFGSGFKVALRDLEIRGAGNLLGAEQHGHMETVGYDMYMRLLNEAILEEKGETPKKKTECSVDMNVSAYIPESFIRSPVQRIDVYKKIAQIENGEDRSDVTDELLDRYGDLPKPVLALLDVSLLRSLGSQCEIGRIIKRGNSVLFYPERFDLRIWTMLASDRKGSMMISLDLKPYVTLRCKPGDNLFSAAAALLRAYLDIRNAGDGKEDANSEKEI